MRVPQAQHLNEFNVEWTRLGWLDGIPFDFFYFYFLRSFDSPVPCTNAVLTKKHLTFSKNEMRDEERKKNNMRTSVNSCWSIALTHTHQWAMPPNSFTRATTYSSHAHVLLNICMASTKRYFVFTCVSWNVFTFRREKKPRRCERASLRIGHCHSAGNGKSSCWKRFMSTENIPVTP